MAITSHFKSEISVRFRSEFVIKKELKCRFNDIFAYLFKIKTKNFCFRIGLNVFFFTNSLFLTMCVYLQ